MKTFDLKKQQFVPRPLREVFPFFEKPENLAAITPPWLGFRIVTHSPIRMREGTVIEYSIRVMGIRTRWTSLISKYEPPYAFADEQLEGPYTFWHHVHRIAEVDGGTLIIDEIRYAMPFGLLGIALHSLIARSRLQKIFTHRTEVIEQMFGQAEPMAELM